MQIAGIIAEYDPLHNGHAYQLAATRAAGADAVVVALGGNFTQRGRPAWANKQLRAAAALRAGADLVVELPLPWAMASAERFAYGGVWLLDALGCLSMLSFGSESGDAAALWELSGLLESGDFPAALREELQNGVPMALARQKAARRLFPALAPLLENPNDLLALEYCKWLRRLESPLRPFAIRRRGAAHGAGGAPAAEPCMASASFLRGLRTMEELCPYVPEDVFPLYEEAASRGELPCDPTRLETAMLAVLRCRSEEELSQVPDALAEGLYHRVYAAIRESGSFDELEARIKTRRYAMTRVRRVLCGAFLGLDSTFSGAPPYCRILGLGPRGAEILHEARRAAPTLPLHSSLAALARRSPQAAACAALESRAADLFWLGVPRPRPCGEEFRASPAKFPAHPD